MSDRARVPAELRAAGPLDAPIEEEDDLNLDAGIMIRDMRTNERFWVHDTVIDDYGPLLGADAFTIYCSLCCMANKAQYCWPSLVRLARHWGKGKTTVSRAVTLLTDLHLVHVKRTQREDGGTSNNIYYLLEPLPLDEGLAHLLAALQARGASPQEAVERAMALLPDNWEPLRRKKTALKARSDWSALMASIVGRSTSGPGQSASEPARSATGPGGTGPGQGESSTGTGGTGVERGVSAEDRGELERNGAGSITERDGYGAGPAPFPDGTAPVPPREPKVTPVEGSPGNQTQEGDQHQGPGGGVTLQTDDEIRQYPLGDDEVLLETEDGHAEPIAIRELVQRDIEATAKNWGVRVWTDCFYSADHFLGIGGETWSPCTATPAPSPSPRPWPPTSPTTWCAVSTATTRPSSSGCARGCATCAAMPVAVWRTRRASCAASWSRASGRRATARHPDDPVSYERGRGDSLLHPQTDVS